MPAAQVLERPPAGETHPPRCLALQLGEQIRVVHVGLLLRGQPVLDHLDRVVDGDVLCDGEVRMR
jgi:hypothetical protein